MRRLFTLGVGVVSGGLLLAGTVAGAASGVPGGTAARAGTPGPAPRFTGYFNAVAPTSARNAWAVELHRPGPTRP